MASGFTGYENTTLTFYLDDGSVTVDPNTGNEIPGRTAIAVSAFMKVLTSETDTKLLQDARVIDPNAIALEGYCVDPMFLPDTIHTEAIADISFGNESGKFYVVMINRPYGRSGLGQQIEAEIGTKITGWLVKN